MVRPERFELPTYWFVASRSIQLSYGRMFKTIDRISRFPGQRNRGFQAAGGCDIGGYAGIKGRLATISKPAWRTSLATEAALSLVASYSTCSVRAMRSNVSR